VLSSLLVSGMVLFASWQGLRVLRAWDLASGSARQLDLERRTYLVSTLLAAALGIELVSLFLYVFTADVVAPLLTGAMCAAGTLRATAFGTPVLLLKLVNFLLAGVWLVVNHADGLGHDYPLVRKKYALLLPLAPLVVLEAGGQLAHFAEIRPDVITSCCGSLFSSEGSGVSSDIAAVPVKVAMGAFYLVLVLTLLSGAVYRLKGKWGGLFSFMSGLFFLVACVSFISFISLYFYELPTHHCPFCVLQREYGYIGYLLYATLLAGVVSGLGVGVLMTFSRIGSLADILPLIQKRLSLLCLAAYLIFGGIVIYRMVSTDFTLGLL
jgi:hypothetical protein